MRRHRTSGFLLALGGWGLAVPAPAQTYQVSPAQGHPAPTTAVSGLESALLQALQANPITAPYRFATETRGNKVALRGRVGSKQVHDLAIQTAIGMDVPVIDDLVIDTAQAHRVAAQALAAEGYGPVAGGNGPVGFGFGPPALGPGLGYNSRAVGFGYGYGPSPYANYPSLFGLVGDPFYGFDPPAISYPPWWAELTAQRLATSPMNVDPGTVIPVDPSQGGVGANAPADPAIGANSNANANANPGDVPIEMTIDPRGVATIRGTVPTLADRIEVGQRIARTQGVSEVVNLLTVRASNAAAIPGRADVPPPPLPAPDGPLDPDRAPVITSEPAGNPGANANPNGADATSRRAEKALADRPALANQGARVKVRDGVATLTGSVPTAYEAMLAYRAVQQTPGVREVDDRLAFTVPDENNPNPLAEKGRPEDVEPYLAAQIRRQVGDIAHIDSVRARGESLEIRGTLGTEEDRGRFEAILRSMPLLRGFKVEPSFGSSSP